MNIEFSAFKGNLLQDNKSCNLFTVYVVIELMVVIMYSADCQRSDGKRK